MKNRFFRVALCVLLAVMMAVLPLTAGAAPKSILMVLKTTVDGGRLREGPSSAYDVVRSLNKGEKVFFSGETSDAFCLVRTTKGEVGYIYEGFLTTYGNVRADQVFYATSNTSIYSSAGGSRSGSLAKNEHVLVFKVTGNWAFIKTMSGKGGFVQTSALTRLP